MLLLLLVKDRSLTYASQVLTDCNHKTDKTAKTKPPNKPSSGITFKRVFHFKAKFPISPSHQFLIGIQYCIKPTCFLDL